MNDDIELLSQKGKVDKNIEQSNTQLLCQNVQVGNVEIDKDAMDEEIELDMLLYKAEIKEEYLGEDYKPVIRAIESLYFRNTPLNTNNMSIPPSKIKRDLGSLKLDNVQLALQIFKEQSKEQKISNRINYLATCIYNSIFDMELKIQNDLIYDGIL